MTIYLLVVFVCGLCLYFYKKSLIPIYWIVMQTLALPIAAYTDGAIFDEDILIAYGRQNAILNYLIVLLTCLKFKKIIKSVNVFRQIFLVILLMLLVALLWCTVNIDSSLTFFTGQRSWIFLTCMVCFMYSSSKITAKQIWYSLLTIFVVELVLSLFNHFAGLRLYVFQYLDMGDLDFEGRYITGTFKRFSNLAGYLVIMQGVISAEFLYKHKMNTKFFYLLTALNGYIIMQTGSRLGLLGFIAAIMIPTLLNYKENRRELILFSSLLAVLVSLVLSVGAFMTTSDAEDGFSRNLIGLSERFNNKSKDKDNTTDRMSEELLERYFTVSPFGQGRTANRSVEAAYGNSNYHDDCPMVYNIVEYGWLYTMLILLYYFNLYKLFYKKTKNDKRTKYCILTVLLLGLMLSISDSGIFATELFFIWVLYSYYCSLSDKTSKLKGNIRNWDIRQKRSTRQEIQKRRKR